jgi:crotonobetainyl-CoA:carnitine CoA-transferase CaiB-like acyl-CoA transferase
VNNLPLSGIRVLDFCQMWAGPHATEWFSVMGAEVIKLETNLKIDFLRTVGAPPGLAGTGPNVGSCFASLNFGKKGIALNMTMPEARELAKKLIAICDVVAENYGGAILERWGLSFEEMKKLNPEIIYYAGSGYGRTGPYKERPGYAEIIDAFTGATFCNGYQGEDPAVIGVSPWTDGAQALTGAFAMLTALRHRSQTREGQYIDAAMIEQGANFLGEQVMSYVINGKVGERVGNRDVAMAPHNSYPCKKTKDEDEWVAIAVANQKEWQSLVKVMGNPDWSKKEIFSDELSRWKNQVELDKYVGEWTRNLGSYEVAGKLQKAGIAAIPSLSTKQIHHDKHMESRGFFVQCDHEVMGKVTLAGLPFRFSDTPKGNYESAPLLGEDNDYVFGGLLGLSKEEIQRLTDEKVLY